VSCKYFETEYVNIISSSCLQLLVFLISLTVLDILFSLIVFFCLSQWQRGLRRGSAAARLLTSWVRIPQGHGYLYVVSVVCCQVEVSATS